MFKTGIRKLDGITYWTFQTESRAGQIPVGKIAEIKREENHILVTTLDGTDMIELSEADRTLLPEKAFGRFMAAGKWSLWRKFVWGSTILTMVFYMGFAKGFSMSDQAFHQLVMGANTQMGNAASAPILPGVMPPQGIVENGAPLVKVPSNIMQGILPGNIK